MSSSVVHTSMNCVPRLECICSLYQDFNILGVGLVSAKRQWSNPINQATVCPELYNPILNTIRSCYLYVLVYSVIYVSWVSFWHFCDKHKTACSKRCIAHETGNWIYKILVNYITWICLEKTSLSGFPSRQVGNAMWTAAIRIEQWPLLGTV